ncbi:major facilitator superfamily domain-containing protein 10 [Scleropages formosus]|uniref:Major facilitator superfamily domain-containing protein 10 n=1 Tax=Scleropages formosus TaxID=113540 RepID=A0A8C9VER9_SCLFO|nr:major facilitator superfamily domain-containing protein 10 [Scleropages formosus]XP_018599629.1 major facilitator superfamily domain-containing protein 10 [Scleropages formosus]XP_018599630.1 major facilitator superfamily domain-containing protein 10 [Scleropages formosus]
MRSSAQAAEGGSSRIITVVFVALLLDLLGFTLILPLLPSILDHYGLQEDSIYQSLQSLVDWFRESIGVPIERKYNSVLFGGLIGSLFSLLQFLSSPLTGAASDYYGRRPLLMLTTAGIMASYALWGVSRSFGVFLLSRVVGGICKGNVSLCTAVVADLPCPKARGRGMAMIGVAFSLGFTVGPMMGAYLGSRASREVFYLGPASLALAFSTADLLFIFAVLPETLRKEKKVASMSAGLQECVHLLSPVSLFNFSAVTQTEQPPTKENMQNLRVLGWVYFSYLFLFSGLEYTLSFLTHQRFQFTGMQQGKMFFFIGITMAIIQGGYARRIKPERQIKTVQMAMVLLIPAFILIGLAWNLIMLYIGLFLYSFAAAVVIPCLSTQVSEHGSFSQKGTVMGILRSLGALARAFGPVVASSVYWLAGAETCYIVSSAFFIVPLALLRRLMQPKKE